MATGPSDAARGAQLYDSRCSSCHSLDQNLVGPRHRGVYGRRAGSLDDFTYSPALKQAQITWNDETLDRWLAAPRRLVPGVRMCFSVSNSADRRALIEYLKSDAAQ
jgi:cytochrome c